jgi:hypothetical protein
MRRSAREPRRAPSSTRSRARTSLRPRKSPIFEYLTHVDKRQELRAVSQARHPVGLCMPSLLTWGRAMANSRAHPLAQTGPALKSPASIVTGTEEKPVEGSCQRRRPNWPRIRRAGAPRCMYRARSRSAIDAAHLQFAPCTTEYDVFMTRHAHVQVFEESLCAVIPTQLQCSSSTAATRCRHR